MKEIRSRSHAKDRLFTLAVWVRGSPTPGTSAVAVDATGPGINGSDPSPSRILRLTAKRDGLLTMGNGAINLIAVGGTTLTYQMWFYDSALAKWVKWGAATVITLATNTVSAQTTRNMAGCKFYAQITALTGTVTEFGYDFT